MHHIPSSIWIRMPADIVSRTERCVAAGVDRKAGRGEVAVFFRADDIAAPGNRLSKLIALFARCRVPLCLALVPAWLTKPRWLALHKSTASNTALWCWHQHGWRHVNHEKTGKKQEFGPARTRIDLEHDICRGRQRLEKLLGKQFYPVFTPPWNRCAATALGVLKQQGYAAVSRSRSSEPSAPSGLPSCDVNVDLHTRREKSPGPGWKNLWVDIQQAIASGQCGIMIHHQRMNPAAFDFLEILIRALANRKEINLTDFRGLQK
jgi:hypothetical protein